MPAGTAGAAGTAGTQDSNKSFFCECVLGNVRGLVEKQDVRPLKQRAREGCAHAPAPAQRRRGRALLRLGELQPGQDRARLRLGRRVELAADGLEAVADFRRTRGGRRVVC